MHLLEKMAYVGEKPWHGLGNQLARQQPIETWKQHAGMDWKIEESEVRYIASSQNIGAIKAFPGNKVLYRSDTKAPLAVVSKRFQVVQPGEILEFYRDLTAYNGFELETAGVLREGRKFWALARTGQSTVLRGGTEWMAIFCWRLPVMGRWPRQPSSLPSGWSATTLLLLLWETVVAPSRCPTAVTSIRTSSSASLG